MLQKDLRPFLAVRSQQKSSRRPFLITREHLKLRSLKAASGKGVGRPGALDIHAEKHKRRSSKKKLLSFA